MNKESFDLNSLYKLKKTEIMKPELVGATGKLVQLESSEQMAIFELAEQRGKKFKKGDTFYVDYSELEKI